MRPIKAVAAVVLALASSAVAAQQVPFETAVVEQETVARERVFDAVIEAVNKATVSAQTSGRIVEVNFDVDDFVEARDVIVRFRDKEQRAALTAAEARHEEAQTTFRRMQDLLEQKLVSQAEYDRAEAALKSARAALEQAREQLEHTVVRAPYSGIVVTRHVEPGEAANPGQPLMTGLSLESLRATANVSQAYIDRVRAAERAAVRLPDGTRLESSALTVSPYADPQSHTFRVRMELPEGQHGVYPGMFVKGVFAVGEERALAVPASAVAYRSEVTGVYVVGEDGALTFRYVRLGRHLPDGGIEVLAGLSAGERVALDPTRAAVHLKEQRAGGAHE